jgi:hypothetical protein
MDDITGLIAVVGIFVILPALIILHYVTKWKTAPRLTDRRDHARRAVPGRPTAR